MDTTNKTIAVYAGTFDPPTQGHLSIISKISKMFDAVHVVLAKSPSKTPTFSAKERSDMLKNSCHRRQLKNVDIHILDDNVYLVTFAKTLNANFLVRGIRDIWDFNYEQNLYTTNKTIDPSIETIYLMPDASLNIVSSSWVKGLVGMRGWDKVISPFVDPHVLSSIVEKYLQKRFYALMERQQFHSESSIRFSWQQIASNYKPYDDCSYHTFAHILYCMDIMDEYVNDITSEEKDDIELALFFHDIFPSETQSVDMLMKCLGHVMTLTKSHTLTSLIMATKHDSDEYSYPCEKIIASVDLAILGDACNYQKYSAKCFKEYWLASELPYNEFSLKWREGRAQFLKKMLNREFIYPYEKLRDVMEETARTNLKNELTLITSHA